MGILQDVATAFNVSIPVAGHFISAYECAYFAGLPIAMGYGYTSADWVGAAMASTVILLAGIIILIRKHK